MRKQSWLKVNLHNFKLGLFTMVIEQMKLEIEVRKWLVYFLISVYFFILVTSLSSNRLFEEMTDKETLVNFSTSLIYLTAVGTWIHVIVTVKLAVSKTVATSQDLLRISIYMTIAFTYVVYPSMVWTYTISIVSYLVNKDSQVSIIQIVIMAITLALGKVLTFLHLRLQRNTIPSNSVLLSSVDTLTEYGNYFINILTIGVIALTQQLPSNYGAKTSTIVGYYSLIAISIWIILRNRIFWNTELNAFYMGGILAVYLFKFYSDIFLWVTNSHYFPITAWFMSSALLYKFAMTHSKNLSIFDLRDSGLPPQCEKVGILFFEDYMVRHRDKTSTLQDESILVKYMGMIIDKLEATMINTDEMEEKVEELYSSWHSFMLKHLLSHKRQEVDNLEAILYLQFICIVPNLVTFRSNLKRYETFCKASLLMEFRHFHMKYLFERKLMLLYKGKIKDDDRNGLSLRSFYRNLIMLDGTSIEDNYLDIQLPIRVKNSYTLFCNDIVELLENERDLFLTLKMQAKIKFSQTFAKNERIASLNQKVMKGIDDFMRLVDQDGVFVGYFFVTIMLYLKNIRYETKRANAIFHIYKTKGQRLFQAPTVGPINKENFLKDNATLEVSLQQGTVGEILDYSPDYYKYLGYRPNKTSISGMNINEMFPEMLRAPHYRYMNEMQQFMQLNNQRDFFLQGFDGALREVRFMVKVAPQINKYTTGVVYLRPLPVIDRDLLVVNKDMKIISAQEGFWEVIKACGINDDLSDLNLLSSDLTKTVSLLRNFQRYTMKFLEKPEVHAKALKRDLTLVFSQIEMQNRTRGMEFEINKEGPYAKTLRGASIIASLEFTSFKEIELTKIYMRLETRGKLQTKINKILERKKSRNINNDKDDSDEGGSAENKLDEVILIWNNGPTAKEQEHRRDHRVFEIDAFVEELIQTLAVHGVLSADNDGINMAPISDDSLQELITSILLFKIEKELIGPMRKVVDKSGFKKKFGGRMKSIVQIKEKEDLLRPLLPMFEATFSNDKDDKDEKLDIFAMRDKPPVIVRSANPKTTRIKKICHIIGLGQKIQNRKENRIPPIGQMEPIPSNDELPELPDIDFLEAPEGPSDLFNALLAPPPPSIMEKREIGDAHIAMQTAFMFTNLIEDRGFFEPLKPLASSHVITQILDNAMKKDRDKTKGGQTERSATSRGSLESQHLVQQVQFNFVKRTSKSDQWIFSIILATYVGLLASLLIFLWTLVNVGSGTGVDQSRDLLTFSHTVVYTENTVKCTLDEKAVLITQEMYPGYLDKNYFDLVSTTLSQQTEKAIYWGQELQVNLDPSLAELWQRSPVDFQAGLISSPKVKLGILPSLNFHLNLVGEVEKLGRQIRSNHNTTNSSLTEALNQKSDFILSNSLESLLPTLRQKIDEVRGPLMRQKRDNIGKRTLIFAICFGIISLISGGLLVWQEIRLNQKMITILKTYTLLKSEEMDWQAHQAEIKSSLFKNFKFEEVDLLKSFLDRPDGIKINLKKRDDNFKGSTRSKRMIGDRMNRSVLFGVFGSVVVTVYLGFLTFMCFMVSNSLSTLYDLEDFFLNHCANTLKMNDHQLNMGLYFLYGQKGSELNVDTAKSFNDFWISSRSSHKALFGTDYFKIDQLLQEDACKKVEEKPGVQQYVIQACRSLVSRDSAKGIIYFLLFFNQFQSTRFDNFKANNSAILATTPSSSQMIGLKEWFQREFSLLRLVHHQILDTFFTQVSNLTLARSLQLTQVIARQMDDLGQEPLYFLVAILIVGGLVLRELTTKDWHTCLETFRIIAPETVHHNPFVYNSFKRILGIQK